MKLTAIMLIINSFLANQHGVDVVNKVIQPIKHISADTSLSSVEFQSDKEVISAAAKFCREINIATALDSALTEIFACYEDTAGFEQHLAKLQSDTGLNFADVFVAIDGMISSVKNDMLLKLSDFDTQVLKRGAELAMLEDTQMLRQVANKSSRFFSELRTLVTQVSVSDVQITASFVNDEDILKLAKLSAQHFAALSA